ncbi:MAG TPA: oligopeptide/dipeptide ABC transporter ATP-binding protein [Steroidobacteraceae bacterium]|nr:oligopeptide/dipeptide ABC transporter ATP-binding protein [Steroidobacteraceae bacterium]
MSATLLQVEGLGVHFAVRGRRLQALEDVSFTLEERGALGVAGESGSGKSTLARAILRLVPRVEGTVRWEGADIYRLAAVELRRRRRHVQIVFQDPLASLDPRQTIGAIVAEPLEVIEPGLARAERAERVRRTLERVGLGADLANRYPHEFSGGQCQRVAIARAIVGSPRLLVCDEPLSSLDVSVQAQIVNLLDDLRRELGIALVFISHNLAVVRRTVQRVLVLYLGRTVELADRDALYATPRHPYTRALLDAVPVPDPARARRGGPTAATDLSSAFASRAGCVFARRCPFAVDRCRQVVPALESAGPGHLVACHRWRELP